MDILSLIKNPWFLLFSILWTLPWKGVALWRAAQRREKYWFVIMLVFNSYAVLEILYIYIFTEETFREKFKKQLKRFKK